MDNLIIILIVIGIVISVIKNVVKKIPVEDQSENQNDQSYEYEYDEDDYDYDEEYDDDVPDSIKELWNKFSNQEEKAGTPPPIPEKRTFVKESIEYEPVDHKPIVHGQTSTDFEAPKHHKNIEEEPEIKPYKIKKKMENQKFRRAKLRDAVVWSEILSKPVSMRE